MRFSFLKLTAVLFLFFFHTHGEGQSYMKSYVDGASYNYGDWIMNGAPIDTISGNSFVIGGFMQHASQVNSLKFSFISKREIYSGEEIWSTTYQSDYDITQLMDLCVLKSGDIVACGITMIPLNQEYSGGFIMKVDTNGVLLWSKKVDDARLWYTYPTADGGFLIAGQDTLCSGCNNVFVGKMTSDGNLLWSTKLYGSPIDYSSPIGVYEGPNGDIILLNRLMHSSYWKSTIICLDAAGNLKHQISLSKEYPNQSTPIGICASGDGGYMVVGSYSGYGWSLRPYIIKLDDSLNVVWDQFLSGGGETSEFIDIVPVNRNKFLIIYEPESFGAVPGNTKRAGFTTVDSSGTFGQTTIITPNYQGMYPNHVDLLQNNKYLFSAYQGKTYFAVVDSTSNIDGFCGNQTVNFYQDVFNYSYEDELISQDTFPMTFTPFQLYEDSMYQVKAVDYCYAWSGLDLIDQNSLEVYPVPTKNKLTISIKNQPNVQIQSINVLNTLGEHVEFDYLSDDIWEKELLFDLPNGFYLIKIGLSNNQEYLKKIVIQH